MTRLEPIHLTATDGQRFQVHTDGKVYREHVTLRRVPETPSNSRLLRQLRAKAHEIREQQRAQAEFEARAEKRREAS